MIFIALLKILRAAQLEADKQLHKSEVSGLQEQLEADKVLHKSEVSGLQDQLLVTKQEHDQQ